MVFKKNMIKKFFAFLFILSSLTACINKKNEIAEIGFSDYKTITLNIFEYKMALNEEKFNLPNDLGFESSFLLDKLTIWGNKKFKVNGEQKSLLLTIEGLSLNKNNIKKNKGLKKIFFSEEEIEYKLKLKISLKFFEQKQVLDSLNLNGNIVFLIKDNYSIIQKKESLSSAYMELIKKVDEALDRELKKQTFSKFKTIQ
tara:strand:- start:210 stop:806 length:597 start_codon:yes stop_codon:yes gene_type:complete